MGLKGEVEEGRANRGVWGIFQLPTVGELLRIREEKGNCGWVFESVECPGGMRSRQNGNHLDSFEWGLRIETS